MKRFISMLALTTGLLTAAACGGEGVTDPTATPSLTPTSTPTEVQDVTFVELFSRPDRYNGRDILLEGFYFHGFETIVLSEKLEYSGLAQGHLWPQGQKIWIEGSIPRVVYDQLHEQEMLGPTERYGKLRIEGTFEYGARYGHLDGYDAQIVPSEVELLAWSPPPIPTATPTPSVTREWNLEDIRVDGTTVTVSLHVFAGIDVRVALDGKQADEVKPTPPILEFVFLNATPGQHTVEVRDVVGFSETAEVVVPPPISAKQPIGGLCIPAAPLGVAVGHTWTLAGLVRADGDFSESSLPEGASQASSSYTVTAIEDSTWSIGEPSPGDRGGDRVFVEHSKIEVQSTQVMRDAHGNVLDSQEQMVKGTTISAPTLSPVLTLDWACHRQAWLQRPTTGNLPGGGTTSAEHTVEETTLSSGTTAVLFLQTLITNVPERGLELTTESVFGYDKLSGILVLTSQRSIGTRNGEPISLVMVQELVSEGTVLADWLADLIVRLKNEPVANPPASITRYEYKGQTVYFVPQRCCDIFSDLYDAEGNIIGHPDGGITGQGDGRVPDFFDERENGQAIWKDKRKHDPSLVQVQAPIESVEVLIMESFPPQYMLLVISGLPNACVSFAGYRLERDDDTIRVEIINWKPADPEMACPATYESLETRIPLGSKFQSGRTYTIEVNDVTDVFVAQ